MYSVIPLMDFNLKDMGYLEYNHLKELDDLHPKKYLIESESHPHLLGWDFDRNPEERTLSITCQTIELSVYSPSLSSWDDYNQHTVDDRIGAKDLSESSFLST